MPLNRSEYVTFTQGLVADQIVKPTQRFFKKEASSSVLLLAATVIALVWANSQVGETYHTFWHTEISVIFGDYHVSKTLVHWINDGLMALFFLLWALKLSAKSSLGNWRLPKKHYYL